MRMIEKDTSMGALRGLVSGEGVCEFRGIRYATAQRWAYPEPVERWDGIYDATKYGDCCIQPRTYKPEESRQPQPFYYREFREGMSFTYSEDCLFLDIYAPEKGCMGNADGQFPVLIYIHGGAFLSGCSHEKPMDGSAYARRGIVFVSVQYRLGVFGFLSDKKLEEESGHTGNYGLYDQLEAIRWVYRHIGEFGGDPEQITLFGQSAGAMSVQQHILSPLSAPYIKAAYMASGGGIGSDFARVGKNEDSYEYWSRLTERLGDTPKQWRECSSRQVMDTFFSVADEHLMEHCCPHIDGCLIPCDPSEITPETTQMRRAAMIPCLLSCNGDDMVAETLYKMSVDWCIRQNNVGGKPAYMFLFDRKLPGDDSGSFHSSELWYTIGAWRKCWRPMTSWDGSLSDALMDSIEQFVRTGAPNGKYVPDWKPVSAEGGEIIVFSDEEIGAKKK